MDSNYYNGNSFNMYNSNYEQTAYKGFSKFTPDKKENVNGNMNTGNFSYNMNDSTLIHTNMKFNYDSGLSKGYGTPERLENNLFKVYENSLLTPVKKSRRRDCTPMDSAGNEEEDANFNGDYYNRDENSGTLPTNLNFGNGSCIQKGQFPYQTFYNNYNLLKANNSMGQVYMNKPFNCQFQKLSKSKFLDKINSENNFNSLNQKDMLECTEILEKIKGNYLLNSIETDTNNPQFLPKLFKNIVDDSDLFNKLTNLICYCLIEGFNNRSDIFFKFLTENVFMEIVDQPMNTFNNNLTLLTNYVTRLNPDYSDFQLDMNYEGNSYVFSLAGNCILTTPNQDSLKFILSFRVLFNLGNGALIRSDYVKIENLISVDYIKMKIFN